MQQSWRCARDQRSSTTPTFASRLCAHPLLHALQSSNPNVLLQWPHALHILGLIYNQQL